MSLVFFFGVAFVLTIVGAYFMRLLASFFLESRTTNVAGFAYAVFQMGFLSHFNEGGASQVSAIGGGLVALGLVWYLFFKRQAS